MGESTRYIHGYHERESQRLSAQATSVLDLLHRDTRYPAGSRVLEVGCGTGAQTVSLALNSPEARITAFDHSFASLAQARTRVDSAGASNVAFLHTDLFTLPFEPTSFDHAFVCFVLEHLPDPIRARVSPRMVYVDATRPDLIDSFSRKTFTWMVEGVRAQALEAGIIDEETFDAGIRDLYRVAEPDGVFCYTFFKGVAVSPATPR